MILWKFLISWRVFPCRDCKFLSFGNLLIWFPSTYNQLLDTDKKPYSHHLEICQEKRRCSLHGALQWNQKINSCCTVSCRVDRWTNTKELLHLSPDECMLLGPFKAHYFQKWICFEKKVLLILLDESDMPSTHRFGL